MVLLKPVRYKHTGNHPRVHNHSVYSSHEIAQTPAIATNLGTVCMSIEGIAYFPHRYFHHCTEITTLACLNQRKNRDRNSDSLSVRRCARQRIYLKAVWYMTARWHQLLSMWFVLYRQQEGFWCRLALFCFCFWGKLWDEGEDEQPVCWEKKEWRQHHGKHLGMPT